METPNNPETKPPNNALKVAAEVAVLLLLLYALGRALHFDPLSLLGLGPKTVSSSGSVTVTANAVQYSAQDGTTRREAKSPDANVEVKPLANGGTKTTIQEFGLTLDPIVGISYAGNEKDSVNDLTVGARFLFVGPSFGASLQGGLERLELGPDFRDENFEISAGLAQEWLSFLNPTTIRPFVSASFFPFDAPGKTTVESAPQTAR